MIKKLLIYILKKLGVKESLPASPKEIVKDDADEENEDLEYFFY